MPAQDGEGTQAGRGPVDLPFRRSMPRPLWVFFALVALGGLALVVVLIVRPGTFGIAVGERRSPPRGALSHDVGRIRPAPAPSPLPETRPPCPALGGVVVEGGPPAQGRLGAALEALCRVMDRGQDLASSVRALATARIRFAQFERTGDPSTVDHDARLVFLNLQLARARSPVLDIAPLLAHEGYHLAHGSEPTTALREYAARTVELLACRLLIDVRRWPRSCEDAQAIVEMGEREAVEALVAVGYAR